MEQFEAYEVQPGTPLTLPLSPNEVFRMNSVSLPYGVRGKACVVVRYTAPGSADTQEVAICTLNSEAGVYQCVVNEIFPEFQKPELKVIGSASVHVCGCVIETLDDGGDDEHVHTDADASVCPQLISKAEENEVSEDDEEDQSNTDGDEEIEEGGDEEEGEEMEEGSEGDEEEEGEELEEGSEDDEEEGEEGSEGDEEELEEETSEEEVESANHITPPRRSLPVQEVGRQKANMSSGMIGKAGSPKAYSPRPSATLQTTNNRNETSQALTSREFASVRSGATSHSPKSSLSPRGSARLSGQKSGRRD